MVCIITIMLANKVSSTCSYCIPLPKLWSYRLINKVYHSVEIMLLHFDQTLLIHFAYTDIFHSVWHNEKVFPHCQEIVQILSDSVWIVLYTCFTVCYTSLQCETLWTLLVHYHYNVLQCLGVKCKTMLRHFLDSVKTLLNTNSHYQDSVATLYYIVVHCCTLLW